MGVMGEMSVTVVIPNYNGIRYMEDCLRSLYAGSRIPKIIVVDNGSTDGSAAWIRSTYPECRVLCFQENKGFCHAVNVGIRQADTEYVILLNNDTRVDREFTERLTEAIQKQPDAFSVAARMVSMADPSLIDSAGDFYCSFGWAFARGKGRDRSLYERPGRIFSACAGAAIYKKSVFREIGYFDERHFAYLEDVDIGYRARLAGYHNYYEPGAVVEHAGSGASGSRYNEFKVSLASRNSIYLIWKNMPGWQILCNLPFLVAGFGIKALFFWKKGLGTTYIRGLREGFRLCRDMGKRQGKQRKRPVMACLRIQLELWYNMGRLRG